MTEDKAIQTMIKLETDGMSHADIAAHMKKIGHKGRRGKPLTATGVGYYLRAYRNGAKQPKPVGDGLPTSTGLLPTETRIELAVKLLTDLTWGSAEQRCIVAVNVLKGQ